MDMGWELSLDLLWLLSGLFVITTRLSELDALILNFCSSSFFLKLLFFSTLLSTLLSFRVEEMVMVCLPDPDLLITMGAFLGCWVIFLIGCFFSGTSKDFLMIIS